VPAGDHAPGFGHLLRRRSKDLGDDRFGSSRRNPARQRETSPAPIAYTSDIDVARDGSHV